MILLGAETSTRRSSVAVTVDGRLVHEETHDAPRGHGAFLAPALRRALDAVDGAPDGVAVGTGPGLYTGLRVGMATAAAFASAREIPLVGITGLEVLVARARSDGATGPVVATLDARRGQVFWLVDVPLPTPVAPVAPVGAVGPVVGTQDGLGEVLAALAAAGTPAHVIGEVGAPELTWPTAADLLALAAPRFAAGEGVAPGALQPIYLRDADVRIGWAERTAPVPADGGQP